MKPYNCLLCGLRFNRLKALASHEKFQHSCYETYECAKCSTVCYTRPSLDEHFEYCSKQVDKPDLLEENFVASSIVEADIKPTIVTDPVKRHACTECSKLFTTKQKMHRHMWIHRRKVFACEVCESTFGQQNELDEHRLSEHSEGSPYVCQECGKCFSSRQGLWEHGRTHNARANSVQFHCAQCNKNFTSRQGYLIHNRTHTGERPYNCRFCWKAFRDGGTLRKHERIHTGERPHSCPLCCRAFNQKVVLREHIRWVHAENKTVNPVFQCELCKQILNDRDELCAHIVRHSDQKCQKRKTVHSKKNEFAKQLNLSCNPKKEKISNDNESSQLIGLHFSCALCSLVFKTRQMLKSHIVEHI